jgi:hypothetical protein
MGRFALTSFIILAAILDVSGIDPASAQTRYFRVCPGETSASCGSPNDFVVALVTQQQLQMADDILSGKITDQVHVQGTIVPQLAPYNAPWQFYLDPNSISFFTLGHPLCWGFSTMDVNSNLSKIGSPDFLPDKTWCPRGYRISEEVHPK